MPAFKDLTGFRSGRLLVLQPTPQLSGNNVKWECLCDCGNIAVINGSHVTTGKTTSCGCVRKERAFQAQFLDLSGQVFGRLTVRSKVLVAGKRASWLCKCECGNSKTVSSTNLQQGRSTSCGCYQKEVNVQLRTTHGLSGTARYSTYKSRRRKCITLRQTPAWADQNEIRNIYNSCPDDHHVDHEIPLRGKLVSGLHVPENLQHLPASENLRKSATFQPYTEIKATGQRIYLDA